MQKSLRVLVVFGTRPEAIKMAPVVLELQKDEGFETVVAVTAQHREMLDQVLDIFRIQPDYDLDIMEHGQSLAQITSRVLMGIGEILENDRFDALLVHGDTTTTFAAALAAFYHHVPVGHVEAGMRSHDLGNPFPEEANRMLVARITRWHFPPSRGCEENLLSEGIPPKDIFPTHCNTVIDALMRARGMDCEFPEGPLRDALSSGRRIILATVHRRESWGRVMEGIFSAIARIAETHPSVHILVATHANPTVADAAQRILGGADRVDLIGPQDYLAFVKLMEAADLILSDSGGIQEEGPALGTPVLVLREVTEYPEIVERGSIALVGTDSRVIAERTADILDDTDLYDAMKASCRGLDIANPSRTIAQVLLSSLSDA